MKKVTFCLMVFLSAVSVQAQCSPVAVLSENFDSTASGEMPPCWSSVINVPEELSTPTIMVVPSNYHSPGNAVLMNNSSSFNGGNIIMVLPQLSTLATATHRLKLFARSFDSTSLVVGTLASVSPDAEFIPFQTLQITGSYAEYIVDFTGYEGTDTYIGIRHNADTGLTPIFIDDMRWEESPLCPDVTGFSLGTSTPDSATFFWNGSDETSWELVYGPVAVTDPSALTVISPSAVEPFATIGGLESNTGYNAWIRSVCGGNDGAWIGPVYFKTPCMPINSFSEGFDTTDSYTLPVCWSAIKAGPGVSQGASVAAVNFNFYSGGNAVELNNSFSPPGSDIILVSPRLGNLDDGTHRLKFWAKATQGTGNIQIVTLNSDGQNASFTVLSTKALSADYTEFVADFQSYAGEDTYIGFRHDGPGFYSNIYLDDIRWEALPACPDVTEIGMTGITVNSAAIAWNPGAGESAWDVVVGPQSVSDPATLAPISPAPAMVPEAQLTGLAANTHYKAWVRSVCVAGEGVWIGPVLFKTQCGAVDVLDEDFEGADFQSVPDCWSTMIAGVDPMAGSSIQTVTWNASTGMKAIQLNNFESNGNAALILISPDLGQLGGHELTFDAAGHLGSLEIGTLDGNTNSAVFSPIATIPLTYIYDQLAFDFSDYAGTDSFIGFRHNSTGTQIYLDNIKWESTLSMEDFDQLQVRSYPNPVIDLLNVSSLEEISKICIYNLMGQKVLESDFEANAARIDMGNFSAGSYLVKCFSGTRSTTMKIVKK